MVIDPIIRALPGVRQLEQRTRDLERASLALTVALVEALKVVRTVDPALARRLRAAGVQATRGHSPQCAQRLTQMDLPPGSTTP